MRYSHRNATHFANARDYRVRLGTWADNLKNYGNLSTIEIAAIFNENNIKTRRGKTFNASKIWNLLSIQ